MDPSPFEPAWISPLGPKDGGDSGEPSTTAELTTTEPPRLPYVYPKGRRSSPRSALDRQSEEIAESVGETVEHLGRLAAAWPSLPQSTRDAIAALTGSKDAELGDVVFAIATAWPQMPTAHRQALRAVAEAFTPAE